MTCLSVPPCLINKPEPFFTSNLLCLRSINKVDVALIVTFVLDEIVREYGSDTVPVTVQLDVSVVDAVDEKVQVPRFTEQLFQRSTEIILRCC